MNTNVLFLSPRFIKPDYIPALFNTLHVARIVSFLSLEHMPSYLSDEVKKYPYCIQDDSQPEFSMHEAVRTLSLCIIDRVKEGGIQADTRKGVVSNGFILVLADWQQVYYGQYEQYYSWISRQNRTFAPWTAENTCFPFRSKHGDLPQLLVDDLDALLDERDEMDMWNHFSLLQNSVFFAPIDSGTLTYYNHSWVVQVYRSRVNPSKTQSFVRHIMLSVARSDQDRFVYTNDHGVRVMTRPVIDETSDNFNQWRRKHEEYLERLREAEARREWMENDDDDDSDVERGCGNGWTCDNCPNFGCPANEMN